MGTNGTLITEEIAKQMLASGSRGSPSPWTDATTASTTAETVTGSFDAAIEGTRACGKVGLPFQIIPRS